jgi:3-deoxy-D-manno-octulosonic-acid transferase
MGPHTFNFAQAAQLAQEAGAALRVGSMEEGVRTAVAVAGDVPRRQAAVTAASEFAAAHQGAASKTAHAVLALLEKQGSSSAAGL